MNVVEIVFSPTGGTEKVAHIIGGHWSKNTVRIDLCDSKIDFTGCNIAKDDMVLIAMPSFGGRAPAVAIERLKLISGNGAKCTLVCVYGNRAYEDTLVEMEDAAKAPTTKSELLSVKGFGEAKFRKYGEDILRICRGEDQSPISGTSL